jgi:type II secretory ATPase GspE/PulE/Tfp pilus assembly ATPase PilB-like protein
MQTYEHIMSIYNERVEEENLKETTMKLLIRCTYGFDSIERCRIIFKMYKRHEKLYEMLKIDEKLKEVKELKRKLNQFKKNTRGKSMTSKEK